MKKLLGVIVAGGALILLVGASTAHWGGGFGPGERGIGHGMMGGHGMGWRSGSTDCPGWRTTAVPEVTEDKAKELAQEFQGGTAQFSHQSVR